eukprot:Rhum_TRINITY_DN13286_c0_g1::Rhum_TRINITY_DN13286_c0_g1_i1::g.58123::m.58123/K17914/KIF13; kinesin family member 13
MSGEASSSRTVPRVGTIAKVVSKTAGAAGTPRERDEQAAFDSGIKVMVRVRPFGERERKVSKAEGRDEPQAVVDVESDYSTIVLLDHAADYADKQPFNFDHCFTAFKPRRITFDDASSSSSAERDHAGVQDSQEEVYNLTGLPALNNAWEGYNACVFAYGQTSSGKTYTMMGTKSEPGIIPRLCRTLFEKVEVVLEQQEQKGNRKTVKVQVSFMEIYNEQVKDLLRPTEKAPKVYQSRFDERPIGEYQNLRVRNHPLHGPFVEGITKKDVDSWRECVDIIRLGTTARSSAATQMNDTSSRSHAIFQLWITQTEYLGAKMKGQPITSNRTAKLNLVDLAGSERTGKTEVKGKQLQEANYINKSLMTLRKVIDTLVSNAQKGQRDAGKLPPYRESLLTWILSDNFGGNAKTIMIANVSPFHQNASETESTLRYATTAKGVVNRVRVNEDASAKLIRELQGQIRDLQHQQKEARDAASDQRIKELEEEIMLSNRAIEELRDRELDFQVMTEKFKVREEQLLEEHARLRARANELESESASLRAQLEETKKSNASSSASAAHVASSSGGGGGASSAAARSGEKRRASKPLSSSSKATDALASSSASASPPTADDARAAGAGGGGGGGGGDGESTLPPVSNGRRASSNAPGMTSVPSFRSLRETRFSRDLFWLDDDAPASSLNTSGTKEGRRKSKPKEKKEKDAAKPQASSAAPAQPLGGGGPRAKVPPPAPLQQPPAQAAQPAQPASGAGGTASASPSLMAVDPLAVEARVSAGPRAGRRAKSEVPTELSSSPVHTAGDDATLLSPLYDSAGGGSPMEPKPGASPVEASGGVPKGRKRRSDLNATPTAPEQVRGVSPVFGGAGRVQGVAPSGSLVGRQPLLPAGGAPRDALDDMIMTPGLTQSSHPKPKNAFMQGSVPFTEDPAPRLQPSHGASSSSGRSRRDGPVSPGTPPARGTAGLRGLGTQGPSTAPVTNVYRRQGARDPLDDLGL